MKRILILLFVAVVLFSIPALAEEGAKVAESGNASSTTVLHLWSIIMGAVAIALAAAAGAMGQSKAIVAVAENISRNPATAGTLRTLLIIGLAFIESLVIYVLLIDLILFFVTW